MSTHPATEEVTMVSEGSSSDETIVASLNRRIDEQGEQGEYALRLATIFQAQALKLEGAESNASLARRFSTNETRIGLFVLIAEILIRCEVTRTDVALSVFDFAAANRHDSGLAAVRARFCEESTTTNKLGITQTKVKWVKGDDAVAIRVASDTLAEKREIKRANLIAAGKSVGKRRAASTPAEDIDKANNLVGGALNKMVTAGRVDAAAVEAWKNLLIVIEEGKALFSEE